MFNIFLSIILVCISLVAIVFTICVLGILISTLIEQYKKNK